MARAGDIFVKFFDRTTEVVALAAIGEGLVTMFDHAATASPAWNGAGGAFHWLGAGSRLVFTLYGALLLVGGGLLIVCARSMQMWGVATAGGWVALGTSAFLTSCFVGQALIGRPKGHGPGAGIAYALIAVLLFGVVSVRQRLHRRAR